MTPRELLAHLDDGTMWPTGHDVAADGDLDRAYETAFAVRALREARGERVAGYKLGWTNRANWARQGVSGPMWGTLHDTSVVSCDGACALELAWATRPRLEPEIVIALRAAPTANASIEELFDCIAWLAPAFEIVQSHLPDWRYTPAQTIADSAVHARLVVGATTPAHLVAASGAALEALLAGARVRVFEGAALRAEGRGEIVLGGPMNALRSFVRDIARRPGATSLKRGDIVSTGTWTDAFELAPGQRWRVEFDVQGLAPLSLAVS
jgi:2-oxo-3-hexenedioate decarboxylase